MVRLFSTQYRIELYVDKYLNINNNMSQNK